MAEPDIRILVSNTGDAAPDGKSAAKIRDNLQKAFNAKPAYLKMDIHSKSLHDIRTKIENSLQGITVDISGKYSGPSGSGGNGGSGSHKSNFSKSNFKESEKQLYKLEQLWNSLNKSKSALTLNGVVVQVKDIQDTYQKLAQDIEAMGKRSDEIGYREKKNIEARIDSLKELIRLYNQAQLPPPTGVNEQYVNDTYADAVSKMNSYTERANKLTFGTLGADALDELTFKFEEVERELIDVGESGEKVTKEQKARISSLIKELNEIIKRYEAMSDTQISNSDYVALQRDRVSTIAQEFTARPDTDQAARAAAIQEQINTLLDEYAKKIEKLSPAEKNRLSELIAKLKEQARESQKIAAEEEARKKKMPAIYDAAKLQLRTFEEYLQTLKPRALTEFATQIENIRKGFNSLNENEIKDAQRAVKAFKADMKTLGYEGGNIVTYIQEKFKSFFTYLVGSGMVMRVMGSLSQIYTNVVDLDGALTDLRIVTGGTIEETEALIDTYNEMAKSLGSTTATVSEAAVEWQRQGYDLSETNTLIKDSMVLSIVGMVDSADAAQYLTSAIKGYKVEVEDASLIVDRLTAVDMKAAVSAGGLAEAMARTANSARLAGVDMNSLIGYLATVGEVTQRDMATVGEAFKTIFARYGNVKLGNLVDDESGESLNDFETALKAVGLTLRDQDGQFRDFNDVMRELGENYDQFTETERSAIATTLGGVRQRENVLVLMENLDQAFEYAEVAANSAGTAMDKFGAYEDSIEYSTKRLTAAFEEFSLTVLDGGIIKWLIDFASGTLEVASSVGSFATNIALVAAGIPSLLAVVNMIKTSGIGAAFSKTKQDLGWPEMTGDNIVPIYCKNVA